MASALDLQEGQVFIVRKAMERAQAKSFNSFARTSGAT